MVDDRFLPADSSCIEELGEEINRNDSLYVAFEDSYKDVMLKMEI